MYRRVQVFGQMHISKISKRAEQENANTHTTHVIFWGFTKHECSSLLPREEPPIPTNLQ